MAELGKKVDMQDTFTMTVEENIREIVWEEGCELTYMLLTPGDKNSNEIAGISISVKEKNRDIRIEKIKIAYDKEKTENDVDKTMNEVNNIICMRIGDRIAELYGISQDNVKVYMEGYGQ